MRVVLQVFLQKIISVNHHKLAQEKAFNCLYCALITYFCNTNSKLLVLRNFLMYNSDMNICVTILASEADSTIKQYLANKGYSTSQIKRFKYDGAICVNGQPVTVRYVLKVGDVLQLNSNERLSTPKFSEQSADILYQDEYLYVANKPYGVAIHPDRAHKTDTFGNMLATSLGQGFQLRIVTRLDKTTSGLVLGALDEITAQKLNEMQLHHQIHKTYTCLVEGIIDTDNEIDLPLARIDGQNKTIVDASGKPSHTIYHVVERRDSATLLQVTPVTGRTHQIRAHLSAIGHPICGDVLYGAKPAEKITLHCEKLHFTHPYTQKTIDVVAPIKF